MATIGFQDPSEMGRRKVEGSGKLLKGPDGFAVLGNGDERKGSSHERWHCIGGGEVSLERTTGVSVLPGDMERDKGEEGRRSVCGADAPRGHTGAPRRLGVLRL